MNILTCIFALVVVAAAETNYEEILSASNDQFTARMFQEAVANNPGKSMVISAFSVMSPLAQLGLAGVGSTHDQILHTLGLPNDDVTKEVFSDVNKRLRGSGADLKFASRVYVRKGAELNAQFADLSKNVFDSDVKNVDFSKNTEAAQEINGWVEKNTNNRIKDLVSADSLSETTSCVLVNAIYFKGQWKKNFTTGPDGYDLDFKVSKDKTVKIPYMTLVDTVPYAESADLNAQIIQLGYQGDTSSLLVILPKEVDGITKLIEKLKDPAVLNKAIKSLSDYEVEIFMPKFKIETTTNLKDVLEKMNVTSVFSPEEAHLNNLLKSESDLYVSEAKQKAFIEVNEEGTEAAAANEFGIVYLSAIIPTNRAIFHADHPFLFFLRDENTTLFSGVYIE